MKVEHPAALRYIFQDDIYLLNSDKMVIKQPVAAVVETSAKPADEAVKQGPPAAPSPIVSPVNAAEVEKPGPSISSLSAIQTPAPAYNFMGANKKRFLILTHYTLADFIAADHLAALQNILKRKGYEIDDVAIFNVATSTHTIIDLVGYFKPEKLLILGEAAVPPGMAVPPLNQPKKMKNGLLLRSFSFDEMMDSTDNKKAFWEQVKNL